MGYVNRIQDGIKSSHFTYAVMLVSKPKIAIKENNIGFLGPFEKTTREFHRAGEWSNVWIRPC